MLMELQTKDLRYNNYHLFREETFKEIEDGGKMAKGSQNIIYPGPDFHLYNTKFPKKYCDIILL